MVVVNYTQPRGKCEEQQLRSMEHKIDNNFSVYFDNLKKFLLVFSLVVYIKF